MQVVYDVQSQDVVIMDVMDIIAKYSSNMNVWSGM